METTENNKGNIMDILYVLNETDMTGGASTLGVFDSPNISRDKLAEYYGGEYREIEHLDIEDSGLEWQKNIICDDKEITLTLHYFILNEI